MEDLDERCAAMSLRPVEDLDEVCLLRVDGPRDESRTSTEGELTRHDRRFE